MLGTALLATALTFGLGYAVAHEAPELPPNTIDCTGFTKARDGNWRVGAPTTFDIGTAKGVHAQWYDRSPGLCTVRRRRPV